MSTIIEDDFEGLKPEYISVDKEILIAAYASTKLAIEYVKLAQIELAKSDESDTIKHRTWEKQMAIDLEALSNRLNLLTQFR